MLLTISDLLNSLPKKTLISNDKLIPLVEGEHLFSLVVLASLNKLKEFFSFANKKIF